MINVKDKNNLPSSQGFLCEQPVSTSDEANASAATVSAEGAAVAQSTLKSLTDSPNKMGLLLFNLDQAKNVLRHKVEDNLHENLSFPELVDHVVDYLTEIVQEDPIRRKMLGVS